MSSNVLKKDELLLETVKQSSNKLSENIKTKETSNTPNISGGY